MSTPTTLPLGTPVVVDQGTFGEWTGRTVVRTAADYDGDFCVARTGAEDNNWTYVDRARLTVIEPPAEPDLDTRIEAARAALAALEEEKEAAERVTLTLTPAQAQAVAEMSFRVGGGGPTRVATDAVGGMLAALGFRGRQGEMSGTLHTVL